MQWVVTTGRSVDEAKDRALDALGIDDSELEFEVLDEAGSTLFGLRRTDARIRARVRPTRPRPKVDRRNRRKGGPSGGRRRRSKREGSGRGGARDEAESSTKDEAEDETPAARPEPRKGGRGRSGRASDTDAGEDRRDGDQPRGGSRRRASTGDGDSRRGTRSERSASETPAAGKPAAERPANDTFDDTDDSPAGTTGDTMSDITLDDQEPSAVGFVQGLVEAFGADAQVEAFADDDEHLEIAVTGDDLGLLVGPRGATLNAIQELTRTAVAQQHSGRLQGRLRVDVAGYRARRKVALERFAADQAERVKETGTAVALEPMSPPDRKIVHDAVNEIDGVHTSSEGEDRRRHVVIQPD